MRGSICCTVHHWQGIDWLACASFSPSRALTCAIPVVVSSPSPAAAAPPRRAVLHDHTHTLSLSHVHHPTLCPLRPHPAAYSTRPSSLPPTHPPPPTLPPPPSTPARPPTPASAPVQAASQKALTLLEQYSSFLIPAVGVAFQLYISSKARGWAEAKKVKEEEAAAVRKAEKNKTGIAPFEPKVEAGGKKGKK